MFGAFGWFDAAYDLNDDLVFGRDLVEPYNVGSWAPGGTSEDELFEILYEPDVPWFKVIALLSLQEEVTRTIEAILLEIVEQECGQLDTQVASAGVRVGGDTQSRVMPWSTFEISPYEPGIEQYQFPVAFVDYCFKAAWTSLEDIPNWHLNHFLTTLGHHNPCMDFGSIESLKKLLGCDISYNAKQTRLYIGCNSGQQVVEDAVVTLDNLLQLAVSIMQNTHHIICAEDCKSKKFSYKWLSHVGLSRTTYAPLSQLPQRENLLNFQSAVSIRAKVKNSQGNWVCDNTQYKQKESLGVPQPFSRFKGHAYMRKQAISISDQIEKVQGLLLLEKEGMNYSPSSWQAGTPLSDRSQRCESSDTSLAPSDAQHGGSEIPKQEAGRPSPRLYQAESEDLICFDGSSPSDESESTNQEPTGPVPCSLLDDIRPVEPHPSVIKPDSMKPKTPDTPGPERPKPSQVDVGSGPQWSSNGLLKILAQVPDGKTRFATTLSTIGDDADIIAGTGTCTSSHWNPLTTEVTYQIECTYDGEQLVVEIDANTFEYSCRGPNTETGRTFIHCPGNAWDMKATVSQSRNLSLSNLHSTIGQAIVDSLAVITATSGEPIVELSSNEQLGCIQAVRVQHLAKYSHEDVPDSLLSIVMFQKLLPSDARSNRRRWTVPKSQRHGQRHSPATSDPSLWFEAYISSSSLEDLLKDNISLSTGDRLPLACEHALQDHCYSFCGPAFDLIARLDQIGWSNNNGISAPPKLTFTDSTAEARERSGKDYTFW
ncbi:hypothetical protein QQS21_003420 [Conoideocrella luteorostrata]|uniref:Uncharacterized protein n=1 Tax=Conoideocrella luteorostrata TaxID=1105319 RepID=A0AAJ0FVK0_9HYPO|nr:hypothetical protein QQS21_003420 [Conoideocrella luteorostrata]